MKITIEIEQPIFDQLEGALKNLTYPGPPRREAGKIVQDLVYPDPVVANWVAEVLMNNISNITRHQPSPEIKALLDQAAGFEQHVKALMRPKVTIEK
jgi:hypothetical protein